MLGDLFASDDPSFVHREELDPWILVLRNRDPASAALHGFGERIDFGRGEDDLGWTNLGLSSGERPQSREQLAELEWFCQVVVRADIESRDAIVDRIARGKHKDRFLIPVMAKL